MAEDEKETSDKSQGKKVISHRSQVIGGGGEPGRVEKLSEVETQRDMAWMRGLIVRELELTEDDAILAQAVAAATSSAGSVSLMFIFMHNFMIAAIGMYACQAGVDLRPHGAPVFLMEKWQRMQRETMKYFKLMGRIPACERDCTGK